MIWFEETAQHASAPKNETVPTESSEGGDGADTAVVEQQLSVTRQELASTRECLEPVIDQHAAANEELKSANEEILSGNEELQSTNEELETSKEELQSVNQELTTVNEQLEHRNQELSRLGDALNNVQASANVPMLEVSVDLRVRSFTPAAGKVLNLAPEDVGRPLENVRLSIEVPDFKALVVEVIDTVQVKEQEVRDHNGRWYALRVHPYRTEDKRIDGAVAVFVDIDEAKSAQESLRESRDYAESLIESMGAPFLILDRELRILSANEPFYRTFAVTPEETKNRLIYDLGNQQWDIPALRHLLEHIISDTPVFKDYEVRHHFEQIGHKVMLLKARQIVRQGRASELIFLTIEDITERKQLEDDLRRGAEQLSEADQRKNEFLAMLAHELRNPLAPIRNGLAILNRISSQDERPRQTREMMERQLEHMTRLLDDLLDVTRITSGKIELHKERVELANVVKHAVETCDSLLEAAGHDLAVQLPTEPLVLQADWVRLVQIIENLLTNAIKYSVQGGRIGLVVEREGTEAVVRVNDLGIGISSEMLPRIWDLFVQAEPNSAVPGVD